MKPLATCITKLFPCFFRPKTVKKQAPQTNNMNQSPASSYGDEENIIEQDGKKAYTQHYSTFENQ